MKKHIYHFNLIEIVLTVAVIAFGVVVILGMIPRGLSVSRETATISFASEIMDQMAGYLSANKNSHGIPDSQPALPPDDYNYLTLLDAASTIMPGVYAYNNGSGNQDGVYLVIHGSKEEIDGENVYNVNFAGVLRVYKHTGEMKTIKVKHKDGHDANDNYDCFDSNGLVCGENTDDFELGETKLQGTTVYMELSYPLSLPADQRTVSSFSFDVPRN